MACSAVQQHGLFEQRVISQTVRASMTRDDSYLELSVYHTTLDRVDVGDMQMECHVWGAFAI